MTDGLAVIKAQSFIKITVSLFNGKGNLKC